MAKEREKTVIELLREDLEDKLFPPKPQGWAGEKLHSVQIIRDIKNYVRVITGRELEIPEKEKEGD